MQIGKFLLQQQMQDLSRAMEAKLGEGTTRMFENMRAQFGESQKLASGPSDDLILLEADCHALLRE